MSPIRLKNHRGSSDSTQPIQETPEFSVPTRTSEVVISNVITEEKSDSNPPVSESSGSQLGSKIGLDEEQIKVLIDDITDQPGLSEQHLQMVQDMKSQLQDTTPVQKEEVISQIQTII